VRFLISLPHVIDQVPAYDIDGGLWWKISPEKKLAGVTGEFKKGSVLAKNFALDRSAEESEVSRLGAHR
jgi:hypothetical protein